MTKSDAPYFTVLIVDSSAHAADLRAILEDAGWTVTVNADASSEQDLVKVARSLAPDVILIAEVVAESLDGYALAESLAPLAPVLMLVPDTDDDRLERVFSSGATDFIRLPPHPVMVRGRLRTLAEAHRLRQETTRLRTRAEHIAEVAADYTYELTVTDDGQMVHQWVTDRFYALAGYKPGEISLVNFWRELVYEDDMAIAEERYRILMQGEAHTGVFRMQAKDGTLYWLQDQATPIMDGDRVTGIIGVGRDITRMKQIEETLRRSSQTLEMSLNVAHLGVWDWNIATGETYFSPEWLEALGYAEGELDGSVDTWRERIHPDDADRVQAALDAHFSDEAPYVVEHRLKAKDGDYRWHIAQGKVIEWQDDGQPRRMVGVQRDVHDSRSMQEALRQSEERHRIISETISDYAYSYIVQEDGLLKKDWSTQAFHDITGYSFEEVDENGWARLLHPDDRPIAAERYVRLLAGEVDISEFRIVTKYGDVRWLRDHGHPVFDEALGRVVRIYGAAQDITQRKQDEQQLQQQAQELRARNEELDAFAYTVAHDLKNPIASMMGFASLIKNYIARMPQEKVIESIDLILESGYKLKEIIDGLLLLAGVNKNKAVEISDLDMKIIVDDARRRLHALVEQTQAEFVMPEQWPAAAGYGPWVEEVWMNYLSNAMKYGGEPPRIEIGAEVLEADGIVRYYVRDNGTGLTDDERQRVFTPFTRLNQAKAEGHGLGLSIVQRIVNKLGGDVTVSSQPGQGSEFSFTLPAFTS